MRARAYGAQVLPQRMARSVPCILELPGAFCCENAHVVSLRTLSGDQQYLAVSPTSYLADVRLTDPPALHRQPACSSLMAEFEVGHVGEQCLGEIAAVVGRG